MGMDDLGGEILALQLGARELFIARVERARESLPKQLRLDEQGETLRAIVRQVQRSMIDTDPVFVRLAHRLVPESAALESGAVGLMIATVASRQFSPAELVGTVDNIVRAATDLAL